MCTNPIYKRKIKLLQICHYCPDPGLFCKRTLYYKKDYFSETFSLQRHKCGKKLGFSCLHLFFYKILLVLCKVLVSFFHELLFQFFFKWFTQIKPWGFLLSNNVIQNDVTQFISPRLRTYFKT